MRETLAGVPEAEMIEPEGIETVRVDMRTGEPAAGDGTMLEIFMADNLPGDEVLDAGGERGDGPGDDGASGAPPIKTVRERAEEVEQLF